MHIILVNQKDCIPVLNAHRLERNVVFLIIKLNHTGCAGVNCQSCLYIFVSITDKKFRFFQCFYQIICFGQVGVQLLGIDGFTQTVHDKDIGYGAKAGQGKVDIKDAFVCGQNHVGKAAAVRCCYGCLQFFGEAKILFGFRGKFGQTVDGYRFFSVQFG